LGNSPVVNTRRVDTRLSTVDGNTMLIGGLIREQRDGSNAGIPYLKDIPILGGLFRTSGASKSTRTELVLLITPYVMEDDYDSRAMTEAFRGQFTWGHDVPLSVKPLPEPIAPTVNGTAPTVESAEPHSQPYKIPAAPLGVVGQPQSDVRAGSRGVVLADPADGAAAPAGASVLPASATKLASPSGPGKPVMDDKLRQELLDTIRGSKK
jgi:general secretion pathway protein D